LILHSIELNAVRKAHLWPRSIIQPPLTDADEQSLTTRAMEEERRPEQHVDVRWSDGDNPAAEAHEGG